MLMNVILGFVYQQEKYKVMEVLSSCEGYTPHFTGWWHVGVFYLYRLQKRLFTFVHSDIINDLLVKLFYKLYFPKQKSV